MVRNGWTHQLGLAPIDTLAEGLSWAAAPRLSLQDQVTPLQQGLMAPQPSSFAHLVSSVIYHADRGKGKCDLHGGRRQVLVEWEGQNQPEIELNDATVTSCRIKFVGEYSSIPLDFGPTRKHPVTLNFASALVSQTIDAT